VAKKTTNQTVKLYNVQFVDDYAVITVTSVEGLDEDEAVEKAIQQLADYYDIDVSSWMLNDVEESV